MSNFADKKPQRLTSLTQDAWVRPFFSLYKRPLILALVLGLFTCLFASALMFTSGYLIARAAEMPGNILMIHLPLVFVRVFGIGKPLLQYLERLMSHDWVLRMTSSMRSKLYNTLESKSLSTLKAYRTGSILGLLTEDIGHLQNLFLRVVFPTIVAWLVYLVVIIASGFFSWWFALVMLLLLGICTVVMPLISLLANRAKQERYKHIKHNLYNELTDNVLGVSDWIFAGRSADYLKRYRSTEETLHHIESSLQSYARKRDLVLRAVFAATIVVIFVWSTGAFGGAHGGMANWIAACVLGFFPLIDVFAPVSDSAAELSLYQDSSRRLGELSTPDSRKPLPSSHPLPTDRQPSLLLDKVSFCYPSSDQLVLKDLSLSVEPGEKIALLGKSGSGKSTLAALIRGDLVPTSGSVTLGGIATSDYGDEITRYIGVIQQQTYLFNWSLFDNLAMGNKNLTEDAIWDALDKVGLKERAEQLPDKLQTLVDEGGLRFSGGERHRIALARVLLHQVSVVILDEPMAGLDPLTEQALLTTMLSALQNKTVIMITHHLAGVDQMDRVVFIEDGAVSLDGKPEDLAASDPYYQRLLAFDRGLTLPKR